MSHLSAQSIRRLCNLHGEGMPPMITPFVGEKRIQNGKSYGLSAASYDLRIAHDLILGPHPGHILSMRLLDAPAGHPSAALATMWGDIRKTPPCFAIAHTLENFAIPRNVSGQICDKSTYARMGLSCFNTFFDPGFIGNGTLELVNHSDEPIVILAGDPICQMVFHWLDQETESPYSGKYQHQPREAVAAILEKDLP